MNDIAPIRKLIDDLEQQIDQLLKHQASFPTIKGDKAIVRLLDQIALLEKAHQGRRQAPFDEPSGKTTTHGSVADMSVQRPYDDVNAMLPERGNHVFHY